MDYQFVMLTTAVTLVLGTTAAVGVFLLKEKIQEAKAAKTDAANAALPAQE